MGPFGLWKDFQYLTDFSPPGCPMAQFMTVADAASSYGLQTGELLNALRHSRRPAR